MLSLQSSKDTISSVSRCLVAAEARTLLFLSIQDVCAIGLHDIKVDAQHDIVVVVIYEVNKQLRQSTAQEVGSLGSLAFNSLPLTSASSSQEYC